jgi:hypothetical protein
MVVSAAHAVVGSSLELPGYDPAPLKFEHPGDLFHSLSGTCCVSGVLTNANSTGEFRNISGSMLQPSFLWLFKCQIHKLFTQT